MWYNRCGTDDEVEVGDFWNVDDDRHLEHDACHDGDVEKGETLRHQLRDVESECRQ